MLQIKIDGPVLNLVVASVIYANETSIYLLCTDLKKNLKKLAL